MKRTALACLAALLASSAARAAAHGCPADLSQWKRVLGAEWLACREVADLTTNGNPYTDTNSLTGMGAPLPSSGALNSRYTAPVGKVGGIQLDGWFPDACNAFQAEPALVARDGSPFIPGCTPPPVAGQTCSTGCHHDASFVLRIPDGWDGHLLTAGTPGIRDQFASDLILSDFALSKRWAYVSQDKGNMGANFFRDGADEAPGEGGRPWEPGAAIAEWSHRVRQATRRARKLLALLGPSYGHAGGVTRSYVAGVSNGGYQTRRALETDRDDDRLYDGGVDWEGTLFIDAVPRGVHKARPSTGFSLFDTLPTALAHYPGNAAGSPADVAAMAAVGFNPQSQPLWNYHWAIYWGLTQKVYRLEFDPEYTGYTCSDPLGAGPPCVAPPALVLPPTDPDASYDLQRRRRENPAIDARLDEVENNGEIRRPLITLHGDNDSLLPIETDSDLYAQMVVQAGNAHRFRYYVVRGGNHVDPQFDDHYGVDDYGNRVLRPMLPCVRNAIDALARWVEHGEAPPPSHAIPRPQHESAEALANVCPLR